MLPSTILIATDGSPAAKIAESFGAEMARVMKPERVIVLSVVRNRIPTQPVAEPLTPPMIDPSMLEPSPELLATYQELQEGVADAIRTIIGDDAVQVQARVVVAVSPAAAIIEEAQGEGVCTHIVIGDRGHGGFTRLLLGSVSQTVLHHAHCPVTVVRS